GVGVTSGRPGPSGFRSPTGRSSDSESCVARNRAEDLMRLTRRAMLAACAAAGAAPAQGDPPAGATGDHGSLGVVIHSFMVRTAGDRTRRGPDRFADPARFLAYAQSLGARGVQVGLGARSDAEAEVLR